VSGVDYNSGLPTSSSTELRRATRQKRGNEMLAAYRERMEAHRIKLVTHGCMLAGDPWMKCLEWQLEWENEILRYRDSNNERADND
jgi:hypothetical protein